MLTSSSIADSLISISRRDASHEAASNTDRETEMEQVIELNGRRYRPSIIGGNWAKSQFEYFSAAANEWRSVINWNRREQLFNLLFAA